MFFFSFIYTESKRFEKTKEINKIITKLDYFFNEQINNLIKSDLKEANQILRNLKLFTYTRFM